MESLTYQKNLKISPKKLRMLRGVIAKLSPQEAVNHLLYVTTKAGQIYLKSVNAAIANATRALNVEVDVLKFKLLTVEEGRVLKRHHEGSRGMAKPILKKFSHLKIILSTDIRAPKSKKIEDKKDKVVKVVKKKTLKKALPHLEKYI